MGYCFMSTSKIKTMGTLASKYNHNYRKVDVANADRDLADKNEELVPLIDSAGKELDYNEAWRERIKDLDWAQKGPRKNAVLAIEVLTTFSREEHIDLDAWKQQNVEWLKKTFDVSPDGKSNILSVIYHADEPGNVHCHAIVVPIDEAGQLNASRFLNGRQKLTEMQNSYAKEMEEFGLERGLENGQASHRDIKKYYADLNNAINVSDPLPQEPAQDYRERVLEELQTVQAAALRERTEKKIQMERQLAEKRIQQEKELKSAKDTFLKEKDGIIEQLKKENASLIRQIQDSKSELTQAENILEQLQERISEKKEELDTILDNITDAEATRKKIAFHDQFQKQYQLLSKIDPSRARHLSDEIQYMSRLKDLTRNR